ncbi:MAG: RtcB family protein [Chitinophagaceae bacterium]
MSKLKLSAKELRTLGYPETPVISIAMQVMQQHYKHTTKEKAMDILSAVLASPAAYLDDAVLKMIAAQLVTVTEAEPEAVSLNKVGISFSIFGQEHIEEAAMHQMYQAAKLPVSIGGALMPDAHAGYGLPIGGVLAVKNAVIPYGVGVDIGCRMSLSIFDIDPVELHRRKDFFARELKEATLFGSGKFFQRAENHAVMDHPSFGALAMLKKLHGKAWKQLGTSGSGNHFAEFGIVEITEKDEVLGVAPGLYTGLLTHSGSRALGAYIANHYTKIARSKRKLPGETSNLAWLGLHEAEGQEYWLAMNLAGEYATACHDVIHRKIAQSLGRKPFKRVENHHNFAWKETWDGQEVIVHRKGATPAGKDVLGIIPGSMVHPGFIVKGKGEAASIQSAAHGAGRKMSRSRAANSVTHSELNMLLQKNGVTLMGGGLDEAPHAYKDIETVMSSQRALVETIGRFQPKIVRMDGTTPEQRTDKRNFF